MFYCILRFYNMFVRLQRVLANIQKKIKNKNSSKIISKNLWFSVILLLYFGQYRFVFLYCKDTNPILKYPVFFKKKNVYKKKCFVFMHTANTLTCFECCFYIKKNIRSFKNVFSYRFLKHKLFSCISGFYNMFVKLQRVLANIPKTIKILFWGGNSSIIHR